jgi:hypothetical protein
VERTLNKRIFLIECSAPHWFKVAGALATADIAIEKWTAWHKGRQFIDGGVFHDTVLAKMALNQDGNKPPLITFDEACERVWREDAQIVYDMMNRFDHSRDQTFLERSSLFLDHICLWRSELDRHKPSLVVFSTPPHVVYDYVLLALCRVLNIKTLMFEEATVFPPYSFPMVDFREGSKDLAEAAKKTYDISSEARAIIAKLRGDYRTAKPQREVEAEQTKTEMLKDGKKALFDLMKATSAADKKYQGKYDENEKLVNTTSLYKERGETLRNSFTRPYSNTSYVEQLISEQKRTEELRSFYHTLCVGAANIEGPYIYVPLAGQPERTSNPQADIFANQILMVMVMAAGMPQGWRLVVKEHPNQFHPSFAVNMCRDEEYYRTMHRFGALLVGTDADPFDLIDRAVTVATTGGTSGLEAAARNKFCLLFGDAWYRDCPGVFRIRTHSDLAAIFQRPIETLAPSPNAFENYIEAVRQSGFEGIADYPPADYPVADDVNANNLTRIIKAELAG